MRVTNSMIYGNSLNNIWRNTRNIHDLVQQIETGKRIQRPSDNPMIGARALRYRTILAETEQFLRNAETGLAWMEIAEASFTEMVDRLMVGSINRLLVDGATGTNEPTNRMDIITELREYINQIALAMNNTYMGRYVFSGFHTDQAPILEENRPNANFIITQQFNARDIEQTIAFQTFRGPNGEPQLPVLTDINILKLPFRNVNFGAIQMPAGTSAADLPTSGAGESIPPSWPIDTLELGIVRPNGVPFEVIVRTSSQQNAYLFEDLGYIDDDPANGPRTPDNTIIFVADTGELVMTNAAREAFMDGTTITYQVNGLNIGDLNPIVYFTSVELTAGVDGTGATVLNYELFDVLQQRIQYEFASGTHVTINSFAQNAFTANMFSDFMRLFEFAESLTSTDPAVLENYFRNVHNLSGHNLDNAVNEFLSNEKNRKQAVLYDRFNNMLKLHERHTHNAMREQTDLGARMARLDMLYTRLEEDDINFTILMSSNEDVDLASALLQRNWNESVLQAALRSTSMISQLSLANFMR